MIALLELGPLPGSPTWELACPALNTGAAGDWLEPLERRATSLRSAGVEGLELVVSDEGCRDPLQLGARYGLLTQLAERLLRLAPGLKLGLQLPAADWPAALGLACSWAQWKPDCWLTLPQWPNQAAHHQEAITQARQVLARLQLPAPLLCLQADQALTDDDAQSLLGLWSTLAAPLVLRQAQGPATCQQASWHLVDLNRLPDNRDEQSVWILSSTLASLPFHELDRALRGWRQPASAH